MFILSYNVSSEIKRITLNETISLAIQKNKELKIQKSNILKAEFAVKEAKAHAFPSLDFTSNFIHYLEKPIFFFPDFQAMLNNSTYGILFKENLIPSDNTKLLPFGLTKMSFLLSNQFENKLQLSQILFNSTVFRGIGASKIYLEFSKTNYQYNLSKLISNTKKSYFLCVLLKDVSQIYHESLNNAYEHLNNIRSLYNQGLVSEFDLMQAEVSVENLKPIVQNSDNDYLNAINDLKLLIDFPIDDSLEFADGIEYVNYDLPNINNLIQSAIENNLEIKTLEFKSKIDEEMVQLYKSENYPYITAFASYSFAGQSNNFNFNNYSQSLVGVQLSINLFNGFQTQSRIEQSIISYKQTEEQLQLLRQFIVKEIKKKISDFQKAKTQIESQRRSIVLAKKAYDIAQTRFRQGTAIYLEVKNAELELRQAKINYEKALFDYLISIADIEHLLGKVNYE